MRMEGRTAAVTGGNSGIGRAIARELTREGAAVAIFGRDRESLDDAARALGPGAFAVSGDVSELRDLDRLFEAVGTAFGGLDVLVAGAGIYESAPFADTTQEFFDRMIAVNLRGVFFTVQRALPVLREGASVVLITSTIHGSGVPGLAVYSAAKAAVRSLARTLAAELQPRGIRVNALSPGVIDTPIFDRLQLGSDRVAELKRGLEAQVPVGRLGTAREVARAALFLASDDSSYITGCELPVSGGLGLL